MALSSPQGSKSPSVSQGEMGLEDGGLHREEQIPKPPEGRGNWWKSWQLIRTKMQRSGRLQSQAVLSTLSNSDTLFMCRLPFRTNTLGWEKVKEWPTRLLKGYYCKIGNCSYKNRGMVLFLNEGGMVKVRWTGSQKNVGSGLCSTLNYLRDIGQFKSYFWI